MSGLQNAVRRVAICCALLWALATASPAGAESAGVKLEPHAASEVDGTARPDIPMSPSGATGTNQPPEHYRLEIVAPQELIEPIRERTLLGRWRNRPDYDPDQFDSLFARLAEEVTALARLQGYFLPEVVVSADSAIVRVEVKPGQQARVRSLQIQFHGPIATEPALSAQIRTRWLLPESSVFLPQQWEQAKRGVVDAFHSSGYLRARVTASSAEVDPQGATADLNVSIDSGPRLVFGELRVSGLERYDARLVENLRTFRTGDPYAFEWLIRMQTRLSQVGYFTSATVTPDLLAVEADPLLKEVPILVEVREARSRRVALGAGFSTDFGARAQVGLDQRNLFGTGWQAETVLLVESARQRLFANVRSPLSPEARYAGLGSSLDRQDIAGERVLRATTYAGIGQRRIDGDGFLSLTHQSEIRRLEAGEGLPVDRDSRVAWVLGYTHTLSRVDSVVDPRRGYALSGQLSGASSSLGSDRSFVRTYARGRYFRPMQADGPYGGATLIGMLELGAVFAKARDDIPSENLFRTGGAQSLRGYRFLSIGVPEAGAVTGGRYLALGSVEYQHPLTSALRGAVFYDRGNATDSLQGFTSYAGYGVGARWKTPVGPVMVDIAWGEEGSRPRLHLSVGYGF